MVESTRFDTVRLTNVPCRLDQCDIRQLFSHEDREHITRISVGPCPHQPSIFNIASITFNHEPSFKKDLVDGEGRLPARGTPGCDGIRVDNTFYGLTPMNTVSGDARADLIAITGLAGRGFGSWQNENGTMWLRDSLPSELPDVRIFIYGYPSKLHGSNSRASVRDYTEGFVQAIRILRSGQEDIQRPLLLIGHSLGCIIIKQALVDSILPASPHTELYQSICGVIFFGAPHRGLNHLALEEILRGKPPEDLVRDLRPDSSLLISLNQNFPYICKHIKIVSCYETWLTNTARLVDPSDPDSAWERNGPREFLVPKTSACLDWPKEREIRIPVHADHSKLAKLTDSVGSDYHQIKEEIKALVKDAPNIMKKRLESVSRRHEVTETRPATEATAQKSCSGFVGDDALPQDLPLASLIPDIDEPDLEVFEGPILTLEDYTLQKRPGFHISCRTPKNQDAKPFWVRIMKRFLPNRTSVKARHSWQPCHIYTLKQPQAIFAKICGEPKAQEWIQKQIEKDAVVYFVIGLETVLDGKGDETRYGRPGTSTVDPSTDQHVAGGEQVSRLRLKRVKFDFFEPNECSPRLKKGNRWVMYPDNRGAWDSENAEAVEATLEDDDDKDIDFEDFDMDF